MKEIRIAEQHNLGLLRTIQITVDGIRYRLFRASVTVAVIAVAVAFLMNILSESLIKRKVAQDTRDEIATMRRVYDWAARLTAAAAPETILRELASDVPGGAVYREDQHMAGIGDEDMARLYEFARTATRCLDFLEELDYGYRRRLVYTAQGVDIFDRLSGEEGWRTFSSGLKEIRSIRFVIPEQEVQTLLADWPRVGATIETIRSRRAEAIAALNEVRGETPVLAALTDADGEFGERIREAGFVLDSDTVGPQIAEQARRIADAQRLEQSVDERQVRQAIAQERNILPGDVTVSMMWSIVNSESGAAWYLARMQEAGCSTEGFDTERILELARARERETKLVAAERVTSDLGRGWLGLGKRMGWLLFVSMLVCGIGISNAMLMTVTERFREIATMKCLGALDGFIMVMFVLEACFLGLVGGVIGAILGNLIALGRMLVAFRIGPAQLMPVGDLFFGMISALVVGIILAAVAAVYPSFKAARLAPMEAMRIE